MRLFTAVLFDEDRKDMLFQTVERLRSLSRGTFTEKENLHLTVNFIGETDRLEAVKQVMQKAVEHTKATEFELSLRGVGKFNRNEGDIWWIGIDQEDTLWRLQRELTQELKKAGFQNIDDREYKPHLTMGRRVVMSSDFNQKEFEAEITPVRQKVDKISLMKSERLQGKLVYTQIYSVELNKEFQKSRNSWEE